MQNLINWFEIPADDITRATKFYTDVFGYVMKVQEMGEMVMSWFPQDKNVSGALVKHKMYKASQDGVVLYLNGGDDLLPLLDKVETAGGKILMPKTKISDEYGYYAIILDTEGNKIGIHSTH